MSSFVLKLIASLSMLADHAGRTLAPGEDVFVILGRLAFPLYAFLCARGAQKTRSISKYLGRLALFALVSELPFDLLWFRGPSLRLQNVGFTLLLGAAACALAALSKARPKSVALPPPLWRFSCLFLAAASVLMAGVLKTDYGAPGALLILLFYLGGESRVFAGLSLLACNVLIAGGDPASLQHFALLAAVPVFLYNGEKGPGGRAFQYAYYGFYPVHMALLYLMA